MRTLGKEKAKRDGTYTKDAKEKKEAQFVRVPILGEILVSKQWTEL